MIRRAVLRGLARVSTGALLLAGLALLFAPLLVPAALIFRYHKATEAALERLIEVDMRVSDLALQAVADLRAARRWDRDFVLGARKFGFDEAGNRFLVRIDIAVDDAIERLAQLRALRADTAADETAGGAIQALRDYRTQFAALAELYAQAGFFESGLEGEVRRAAHAVEAAVSGNVRLTALHLEMRRHEKDFLLRTRDQDAAQFDAAAAVFNRAAPGPVRALSDAYAARFADYVALQERIDEAEPAYLAAARTAEPLLAELHADSVARVRALRQNYSAGEATSERTVLAFSLLTLALAATGGVLMARYLGRKAHATASFAARVAGGDFEARLPAQGPSDERQLAAALNRMASTLGESHARLQSQLDFTEQLLEAMPFPVVYKGRDGGYLGCNRAFAEFTGLPREQIVGKTAWDLNPREMAASLVEADAELLAAGGERSYEAQLRRADGAQRTVILTKACFGGDGEPSAGIIVALVDVTERVEQERRVRALFESNPLPITLESRRRLVQVNPAFEQVFGYTQQEAVGLPIRRLFRSDDEVERSGREAREKLPAGGTLRREMELVAHDGRVLTCDVSLRALDPADLAKGVVAIIDDITERAQRERELRALIEASPLAITLTVDRKVVRVNPAFEHLFGYAADEVLGRTLQFVYADPDEFERVGQDASAPFARGELVQRELEMVARDGRRLTCELTGKALDPTASYAGGTVSIIQDIGERKRAEGDRQRLLEELDRNNRLLQEVDRVKSEFLATLSHELRTPLNHVLGFTEILRHKLRARLDEDEDEMLGHVFDSGNELLRLMDGLLKLAEIGAAVMSLRPVPTDIRELLRDAVDQQQAEAQRREIRIELTVDPGVGVALIDPEAVTRIVEQLLSNAIKFNRDGGRVDISVRHLPAENGAPPALELAVKDNGIGIEQAELPNIFKPFHQLDASATRRHGGVGIGLALTKQFVELLGGSIVVQSEPTGSCFTVRLPFAAGGDLPPPALS